MSSGGSPSSSRREHIRSANTTQHKTDVGDISYVT